MKTIVFLRLREIFVIMRTAFYNKRMGQGSCPSDPSSFERGESGACQVVEYREKAAAETGKKSHPGIRDD